MKITIEIQVEEDGECPDGDIYALIPKIIPGVWLSEEIAKPDEWALLIESYEIKIEK